MNLLVQRSELRDRYDKVAAGERISEADALRSFMKDNLPACLHHFRRLGWK